MPPEVRVAESEGSRRSTIRSECDRRADGRRLRRPELTDLARVRCLRVRGQSLHSTFNLLSGRNG